MIVSLAEAVKRQDLQVEIEAVRDSSLQSAKFIGRDIETQQLTGALNEAKQRRGSA